MIMWIVVREVVKTFPLKWKHQEIWEQNHLRDHGETTVGVRGRQMTFLKKQLYMSRKTYSVTSE